jgi:hypothetical protein
MKLESHIQKLKEHIAGIQWGVRQSNGSAVGFHASAGSVDLFSIMLHKLELVSQGFQVNHTWFRSKAIMCEKFSFDFPKKTEILDIMEEIEDLRNPLCYGRGDNEKLGLITERFQKLRKMVEEITGEHYG